MHEHRQSQDLPGRDGDTPSLSFETPPDAPWSTPLDGDRESKEGASTPSFGRWLAEMVVLVGLAALLALGVRTFVVQPFMIPSSSMEPTLLIGDRVLVSKFAYRLAAPKAGDVVVFVPTTDTSRDFIKRIVAVGGQSVDIRDGKVYVDGKALVEPYVNKLFPDHYDSDAPIDVPKGMVFLMGDNRTNSEDSRYIGPQPVSGILGRAFVIYWPLGRIRTL